MNDFVVVAVRPQSSVESLLNSTVLDPARMPFELTVGAEIATLVSRRSFFEDILRKSFPVKGSKSGEPTASTAATQQQQQQQQQPVDDSLSSFVMVERSECCTTTSSGAGHDASTAKQQQDAVDISLEHWHRIFKQFQADIHREAFFIAGTQYDDAFTAHTALRSFLATTLEAFSHSKQKDDAAATAAASASLWRWPWSSRAPPTPSPPDTHSRSPSDNEEVGGDVDRLCREVILLSQQSVLGFPLEVIQSYVDSAASASTVFRGVQLFVGEMSKEHHRGGGDASNNGSGCVKPNLMRVEVSTAPRDGGEGCRAPMLSVNKTLRVFLIDEETLQDTTAFLIHATLNVDLLGTLDDPVQLSWAVVDASNNSALKAASSSSPDTATTQSQEEEEGQSPNGRRCECLGAASGFHRTGCPFRK